MKIKKIEQKPIITGTITKFIPMPNIKNIVEQVQEASSIAQEAAERAEVFSQEAEQSARASAESVSTIIQLKQDTKNFANVASEKAEIAMRASENTQSIIASVTEAAAQAVDNATQAKNAKAAAQLAASKVAQAELKAQQIVQIADDIQNNIESINATKDIVLDAKNRTIEAKNSAINANDNAQNAKVAAETAKNSAVIAQEAAEDAAEEAKNIANDIKQAAEIAAEAIESASSANSSAQSASASASSAATSAETASASAQSAETAKTAAESSATAAEASATDAESAKTAALAAKGAAETAAASAEQSATDAGNYAGLAEAAEQDAQAAKTAAEASATAAAESASAASGSASQAAQSASDASASATAASTSATNAEAARTGAEAAQAAAETAQSKAEEAQASAEQSATTAEWYAERVERFLPTDTASGEIASFPDGADNVPMQSVVVSMEPIQDLHGYDHPWPAGGGKNLLPAQIDTIKSINSSGTWSDNVYTWNGVTFAFSTTDDGYVTAVTVNGTATSNAFVRLDNSSGQDVWILPDTKYIISGSPSGANASECRLQINYNQKTGAISAAGVNVSFTTTSESITEQDCYIILLSGNTANNFVFKPMIRLATETDATFAPYSNICPISGRTGLSVYVSPTTEQTDATTYSVSWQAEAGTVYGGTLDVVSGDLVVDRAYYAVTNDTELALDSLYTDFSRVNIVDGTGRLSGKPKGAIISNVFKPGTLKVNGVFMHGTTGTINLTPSISIGTTLPEIKAWLIANNVALCYELATPITYHLTPQEVRTLLGANNVWSDAGDTAVTYKADVQLYIDKKITDLQALVLENISNS